MSNQKILKYLEHFSLITVGSNKVPNFSWKKYQTEKNTPENFLNQLNYKGGKFKKDGTELPPTDNFGIVTGFEYLECIDVDLKVFSTAKEKKDFWHEYIDHLENNILDFKDKIAVYKTKNEGYHLLYKTKRVEGNLKLAKLKGHKEAVIETRGLGGYVFAYPEKKVYEKSYFNISFISDEDREVIMHTSKMYNYEEPKEFVPDAKTKETFIKGELTPWQDFNDKTNIWDLISSEFSIPSNGIKNKHILIKRHNSTSPHSGYIFKDSGCMYLFSTATKYPHEKLLTAFDVYTIQNHNGNYSDSASDLYKKGFGSRIKKIIEEKKSSLPKNSDIIQEFKINKDKLRFPIEIFPDDIQSYIMECHEKLNSNIDYMGCSLLWLISVCIGNSIQIEVKRGWNETAVLWLSLIGKAGVGKTPSINNILFPLLKLNSKEIKKYYDELEKFEFYDKLSKKEKEDYPEVHKPLKTQFVANDITLEALVDLHQDSDNSVGVFKDELAGWLKDMNKYRAGSDLEFWLSCWSGKSVHLNRLTRKGSFVENPFIPVIGGIQPSILNSFYTEENKDNGFLDRMLLSFPEIEIELYNENELDYDVISWYKDTIIMFYEQIKKSTIKTEGKIEPYIANFSEEAKKEWIRIFNSISNCQNDDKENEYLKSMYPKQKSYIPRFSLILHVFNEFFDQSGNSLSISKASVLKAELLSNYFIETAKKVKFDSVQVNEIKKTSKDGKTNFDKLKLIFNDNPNFNRTQVAELLGISRVTVNNLIKKIKSVN